MAPALLEAGADIARNRALWTIVNSQFTDEDADRAWAAKEVTWGLFHVPERDLGVLGDVRGLDVVELGCGTAYLSAQLARQGARPVGVDLTPAQLATAARCQQRFGVVFPLVEANAEDVPLSDAGFDLVVSEYGASLWCHPERWVAEAARLLRPGGRLVFLTNSVLATLCVQKTRGSPRGVPPAPATGAAPGGVAGWWGRVPPYPRPVDPRAGRQRVRHRHPA
jgi:SAM-dependent methyltransferase